MFIKLQKAITGNLKIVNFDYKYLIKFLQLRIVVVFSIIIFIRVLFQLVYTIQSSIKQFHV